MNRRYSIRLRKDVYQRLIASLEYMKMLSHIMQHRCIGAWMRHARMIYTAAALTAALSFDNRATADTISTSYGDLTVAATWRAQPSTIQPGGTTRFKLSLTATGDDTVSGIAFGQSIFHFESGSASSVPTSMDVAYAGSAASAGNSITAALPSLAVTYIDEGIYTATMQTTDAGISWTAGGNAMSGTYSLDIGTEIGVQQSAPTIQTASVPLLIGLGKSFDFSALASSESLNNLSYQWDFNYDGTFAADSAQQNASYAYTTTGVHVGMLQVSDGNGVTPFEFRVDVANSPFIPASVPLPTAVWGGLGLIGAVGILRMRTGRSQDDRGSIL